MSLTDVILTVVSVGLLLLIIGTKMDVQKLNAKVSNNQATAQILLNDYSDMKKQLDSFRTPDSFLDYSVLLENAARILPLYPLTTLNSTDLKSFKKVISFNNFYEITKMDDEYFIAYPGVGTTFSIQVLSSSFPKKVLRLVNSLRAQQIPAFEIPYPNTTALFIGVFPNYNLASEYASKTSEIIYQTVKATPSSWIIRPIP
jgi:hypothetical protein